VNETRFLRHEPCPKCGSRNNLGVWDDGHKYCFGCRYYVPPDDNISSLKKRFTVENNYNVVDAIDVSDFTHSIPEKAIKWLTKYGITREEILHFGICWNPKSDSLVFPIRNSDGVVVVTNERYFGSNPHAQKYKTYGHKSQKQLFINHPNNPRTLVMVEDFVSAIKVGRFVCAMPLLGSTMPEAALRWATGRYKKLRVWLDMDKASQSLGEAAKASQYIPDCRSIITDLDPKEYSMEQIHGILMESGCL